MLATPTCAPSRLNVSPPLTRVIVLPDGKAYFGRKTTARATMGLGKFVLGALDVDFNRA